MGMMGMADPCRVSNAGKGSKAVCQSLKEEMLFAEGTAAGAGAATHMTRQARPIPLSLRGPEN